MTKDEALRLAKELDGVIADVEQGDGFDDVCLDTVKYVRDALAEHVGDANKMVDQPAYRAVKTFHEGKPVYVAEQPARPYRLLQDNGSKYFGDSWDKAEQPAQGCEFCSHPLYAGTKCKHCGKPA